jgi:putative mRNA 3-end processing factor
MYTTALTKELVRLLLNDMIRIGGDRLAFEGTEVKNLLKNTQTLTYNEPLQVHSKMRVTLHDAGHIPGSASILVETEANGNGAARIFYTGDLNTTNTHLVKGASSLRQLGDLDVVIVESTYARENHPSRKTTEEDFVKNVRITLERGGTALIPAFAVGRSQEVLSVLTQYRHQGLDYPIFLDGMARKVTRLMQGQARSFSGGAKLNKAAKQATFIRNNSDREAATKNPAIIVAPAGMLKGGAAQRYLKDIAADSRSSVFLVGKQLPGTPGAELLDQKQITMKLGNEIPSVVPVKAQVKAYNFSCHVDRKDVLNFLRQVRGNPRILTMHGDASACENLAQTLRDRFGFDATAATSGQTISVN